MGLFSGKKQQLVLPFIVNKNFQKMNNLANENRDLIIFLYWKYCLTVSVVHCHALETIYSELNSTDTEFGVTVNISCLPGYRINAQTTATVHCTSTGHWSLNDTCLRTLYSTAS